MGLSPCTAVVMKYVASSLVHDLYSQLATELPSLGFYTWVEHRYKLSNTSPAQSRIQCTREGIPWPSEGG